MRKEETNLWVDEGHDTTLGDDDMAKEFVQLLIVPDGKLKMTRHNTLLLVIARCVACELKNFGSKIFKDCCEVNWKEKKLQVKKA